MGSGSGRLGGWGGDRQGIPDINFANISPKRKFSGRISRGHPGSFALKTPVRALEQETCQRGQS